MKIIIEVEINTRVVTSEEEQGATTGATGSQEIVLVPVVEQEDEEFDQELRPFPNPILS